MLLYAARSAYVLAAVAALAAALCRREHRDIAAVLIIAAVLVLVRAAGVPAALDAVVLLALPALAAGASLRLLAGARTRLVVPVGLGVLLLGIAALRVGLEQREAFRVAHLSAAAIELLAISRWVVGRRDGRAMTPDAAALVLIAGDVALALAQPLVARCGWQAAQLQAVAIMGIVAALEARSVWRESRS